MSDSHDFGSFAASAAPASAARGPDGNPVQGERTTDHPSGKPRNPASLPPVGLQTPLPEALGGAASGSFVLPCDFSDYELLEEAGRGGMGIVFKARQKSLGRLVALKMVREESRSSDTSQQRLGREARAAAALDHPNIVSIYEVGQHAGYQYFTMAYVEGETLAHAARGRGLPLPQAVRLVEVVAEAIDHAHQMGVIHRDLKPSNVLIDRNGRPRVTDFGLAKQTGVDGSLTGSGQVVGTPSYMAPEQAIGTARGTVGPLADVYALGGLLYFALTGRRPSPGRPSLRS